MGDRPTLLMIGAASRDLDPSDPRGWRLGGTVSYASLAAARLGVQVFALVGADPDAATATELELLREAGVRVRVEPLERGPVFDNRQTANGRVQIAHQASDRISVTSLPPEWARADAVLLGPVADELGEGWAAALSTAAFVALTWQGLLRRVKPGRPVETKPLSRSALVARANVVVLSAEDIAGGAPPIRELLNDGQRLLLTHGDRGAVSMRLEAGRLQGRAVPAVVAPATVDTTGAGDTFAAGWIAARLLVPEATDAAHLAVAAAMSSLKVARQGLAAMPGASELCDQLFRLREARRS